MKNHVSAWRLPCVYFLLKGNEIVYIGKTTSLKDRIGYHQRQSMDFDEVRTKQYPLEKLDEYERIWIQYFKPKHNKANRHDPKIICETKTTFLKKIMKFRKLTLKSILGFGKFQSFTVSRMIQNHQSIHLCQAYFNLSHISFAEDVLSLLKITPEWYIKKPGTDREKFFEFRKIVYPEIEGINEYKYSIATRSKALSFLKASEIHNHRKSYHRKFNQK